MISKEDVQHIGKLARISLSAKEIEKFQKDLGSILDYFEILKEVHVEGVEPTTHSIPLQNVTRADSSGTRDSSDAKIVVDMAPETKDGFVKVKSILS